MVAGTASLLLLFSVFMSASGGQRFMSRRRVADEIIKVKSGQDVTLTCRAPNNNIIVLKWSRADLGDEHVLFYRDGHFLTDDQHPSFKNRVDLQDRQMKDGDVSLILKNVTINDAGTYKCRFTTQVGVRNYLSLISIIYLNVDPPDEIIPAIFGQDVTLTSQAPNNNIKVVKWIRADLGDKYVLLYQDDHFDPDNQHPSFKNRVDLQDRQMKDGDVSLILRDVTINDAGTYECYVAQNSEETMELMSRISLRVADEIITAESGQDVTLTSRATNNNIIVVEWSRADLGDENVLFYQNGHFLTDDQHPSFKNRVDLQDRQMKDGDVSLILKNVTINDAGTYMCRVFMNESRSWKSISFIHLRVDPPDQKIIIDPALENSQAQMKLGYTQAVKPEVDSSGEIDGEPSHLDLERLRFASFPLDDLLHLASQISTALPSSTISSRSSSNPSTATLYPSAQRVTSFLTDRKQQVRLGEITSETRSLSTGVPQGCVLSLLLFSLYTNDCTSKNSAVKLLKFADDTTVIGLIQDGDESAYRQEVEQLVLWCSQHNLELNTLKTVEMTADFRRHPSTLPPLIISDSPVSTVETFISK
ncbi:hypothetical protein ACER0C_002407 [Sarotherodon galilaeus]